MKPLYLLAIGVVVGWAASGVDWSRDAVAQEGELQFDQSKPARVAQPEGTTTRSLRPVDAAAVANAATAEAISTTTVTEGTISAPPQKGMAEWLGAASNSAGVNRYQISAYSDQGRDGAYVVDSVTGKVWRVRGGMKAIVVTDQLPEK